MNVFLTVDVECYSGDYEAEVYGAGLGLPFILEVCRRHQCRATFFVEALGATRWGDVGVRRICKDLIEHQQDIQLHIHPSVAGDLAIYSRNQDEASEQKCAKIAKAVTAGTPQPHGNILELKPIVFAPQANPFPPSRSSRASVQDLSAGSASAEAPKGISLADCCDTFCALDEGMQEHLLRIGKAILEDCGAPAITAFRAGDLAASEQTLSAMDRVGIHIGSNRDLDGKCSIRSELNQAFPVVNDLSVLNRQVDLPVTVMRSPFPFLDGKVRHFEVSALGSAEMIDGLRRLKKAGYATATILTHPGEFFRHVDGRYVPIQKNCRRLDALLKFLAVEPGMTGCCVSDGAEIIHPFQSPVIPMFSPMFSLVRIAQQSKHRLWAKRMGVRP